MKRGGGGALLLLPLTLSFIFPDSKKVPIYSWVEKVFRSSDSEARARTHDLPATFCTII